MSYSTLDNPSGTCLGSDHEIDFHDQMSKGTARGAARPRVSTVVKLRDLLLLFSAQKQIWGLTELAEELDWDTATTHRLANALVEIELLARLDGESSYQLGRSRSSSARPTSAPCRSGARSSRRWRHWRPIRV